MKRVLLSFILALGACSSNIIYFEYSCITDERWPNFLGFPFVQNTDTAWVNSMSGELFLFGLLGNILFWMLIIFVMLILFDRIKSANIKRALNVFIIVLMLSSLLVAISYFGAIEWRFSTTHDNFKLNYYEEDLNCERTWHLFN